jgi:hypothetical protein
MRYYDENDYLSAVISDDLSDVSLKLREVSEEISSFLSNDEQFVFGVPNSIRVVEDVFQDLDQSDEISEFHLIISDIRENLRDGEFEESVEDVA